MVTSQKNKVKNNPIIRDMKNEVEAAHTIFEVVRNDWSFQVYEEMEKRYRCEIDAQIEKENFEFVAGSTSSHSAIWKVINENIKGSHSRREIISLDATMMN
ncbi:hypothetical protein HHI36_002698 [Cryptolaemus montrouzieri]|uniref:Uncharacterized protein n=1 Tax=Cryptolaemus montrouzieri TaxID=559131 RepID=A0ABD2PBR0_9CUCU